MTWLFLHLNKHTHTYIKEREITNRTLYILSMQVLKISTIILSIWNVFLFIVVIALQWWWEERERDVWFLSSSTGTDVTVGKVSRSLCKYSCMTCANISLLQLVKISLFLYVLILISFSMLHKRISSRFCS